jgi:prophage regulatory protein
MNHTTSGADGAIQMLSAKAVAARMGVSRALIYHLVKAKGFPRPIKIGGRSAWLEHEVAAWVMARAEARGSLDVPAAE